MPLDVQVIRDGKPVKRFWDGDMLSFCFTVALQEGDPEWMYAPKEEKRMKDLGKWKLDTKGKSKHDGEEFDQYVDFSFAPIYYLDSRASIMTQGSHVVQRQHRFFQGSTGKVIIFKPGDVIHAHRVSKREVEIDS